MASKKADVMPVVTPKCPACGLGGLLVLDLEGLFALTALGWSVGDAFPEQTPEVREQIASGFHPECRK